MSNNKGEKECVDLLRLITLSDIMLTGFAKKKKALPFVSQNEAKIYDALLSLAKSFKVFVNTKI